MTTALALAPPDPPSELNGDAQWKWRETWPRLDHNRFNLSRDRGILVRYCIAYADLRQADRLIDAYGKEYKRRSEAPALRPNGEVAKELMPGKGGLVTNAYVEMRRDALARMTECEQELGLYPDAPRSIAWNEIVPLLSPMPGCEEEIIELPDGTPGVGKPGNPGSKPFWTMERVWPALQKSGGVIADAARILSATYKRKCSRQTISTLVNKYPELKAACQEAERALVDGCYSSVASRALAGNERAQEFLLRALDPRFKNKTELTGAGGGPVQVATVSEVPRPGDEIFADLDDSLLSDDDKVELASIAELADRLGAISKLDLRTFARMKDLQAKGQVKAIEQTEQTGQEAA